MRDERTRKKDDGCETREQMVTSKGCQYEIKGFQVGFGMGRDEEGEIE